jgi:septal ring factor EnvC (AmiA/AmiB activator)
MNKLPLFKNISSPTVLFNGFLLFFIFSLPMHSSFASNELSVIQKQIKQSKGSQSQQIQQQQKLEDRVARLEQETASASLKSEKTSQAIQDESDNFNELIAQTQQFEKNKIEQQKMLEQQLISAYMTGQNDLIKLILNQEDISKIVRAKSYYDYLNLARIESIQNLQDTQIQLEKNKIAQEKSLLALKELHAQQKISQKQLTQQRNDRTKALRELKQDLNYQNARLAQLSDQEQQLKLKIHKQREANQERALAAAKQKASKKIKPKNKDKTHSSIAKQRGQLNWPINGEILSSFGSQRSSQVKWKGIAIDANEGERVRAVASGKVLFAGYFKGYGMVIALDHSDDYITLYGYNQTLLQKTGDIVFQGDAIALAGQSGGQERNLLYFELSHKGKAQDPIKWLKKRRR